MTPWEARAAAFANGALVIVLDGEGIRPIAALRRRLDPRTAAMIGPHVTLTPPFATRPGVADLDRLGRIVAARLPMQLAIGPANRFPGTDVVYLDAGPRDEITVLRRDLVATGRFAPDPFPGGAFHPHVTIHELGGVADEAERAAAALDPISISCRHVVWVAPDATGRFDVRATLP